jgi:hypothetical protein
MAAAIASNIASPTAAKDNVIVTVSGLPVNDSNNYDANRYPTERALVYRLMYDSPGPTTQYDMTSMAFSPKADGSFSHRPLMFPVAGAWTVTCVDQDANVVATQAITVQ